jgi:hypothetical protein
MNNILKTYSRNYITWLLIIFIFSLIIYKHLSPGSDPDIWWHLKVGHDILKTGIQFKDIYSYTLSGYEWIDHEWLLNVCMYIFYKLSNNNFILLAIIFSSLSFFSFYNILHLIQPKIKNTTLWLCFLLGLLICSCCLGIRAQVVSLFFASCFWGIVYSQKLKKYKYFPLLFLIWANFHGAVIIGLAILGLDLLCSYKKKKIFKYKAFIFVLCFLGTLINPYHFQIYLESFRVFLDSTSHELIKEWRNPDLRKSELIPFIIYIISLYYFLFRFKTKLLQFVIILIFTVLALRSVRHFPLFILLSLPFYARSLEDCLEKNNKYFLHTTNLAFFISFFGILSFGSFALHLSQNGFKQITQQTVYYQKYPQKALDFIERKKLKGNILAEYEWGGFIAWYKPNIKVFIDGRMPSWKGVLKDFVLIRRHANQSIIQKYQVKYLLLNTKEYYSFPKWQIIYKDNISIILAKPSRISEK